MKMPSYSMMTLCLSFCCLIYFQSASWACRDNPFLDDKETENIYNAWLVIWLKVQKDQNIVRRDELVEKLDKKKKLYFERMALLKYFKPKIVALNMALNDSKFGAFGAKQREIKNLQRTVLKNLENIDGTSFQGSEAQRYEEIEKDIGKFMNRLIQERQNLEKIKKVAEQDKRQYYIEKSLKIMTEDDEVEVAYAFGQRSIKIDDLENLDQDIEELEKDIKLLNENDINRHYEAAIVELEKELKEGREAIEARIQEIRNDSNRMIKN